MKRIHLVFPEQVIQQGLPDALREAGYDIVDVDYTLAGFAMAECNADIAMVNILTARRDKDETIELFKKIRRKHPKLRIIVLLPESDRDDRSLREALVRVAIYDLRYATDFSIDDIKRWIEEEMTIAHHLDIMRDKIDGQFEEGSVTLQTKQESKQEEVKTKEEKKEKQSVFNKLFKKKEKPMDRSKEEQREHSKEPSLNKLFEPEETSSFTNKKKVENVVAEPTHDTVWKKPEQSATIISMWSGSKGSTGKTFLSLNFGSYLATRKKAKVAVVDLDIETQGASVIAFPEGAYQGTKSYVYQVDVYSHHYHEPDKLDLLLQTYDYIIFDHGVTFDTVTQEALKKSDFIFLVTLPETITVAIIKRFLGRVNLQKITSLIINRFIFGEGLTVEEVAKRMGLPVASVVPYDLQSIEKGMKYKKPAYAVDGSRLDDAFEDLYTKIKAYPKTSRKSSNEEVTAKRSASFEIPPSQNVQLERQNETTTATATLTVPLPEQPAQKVRTKTIAIMSNVGGAGTTSIAASLIAYFSTRGLDVSWEGEDLTFFFGPSSKTKGTIHIVDAKKNFDLKGADQTIYVTVPTAYSFETFKPPKESVLVINRIPQNSTRSSIVLLMEQMSQYIVKIPENDAIDRAIVDKKPPLTEEPFATAVADIVAYLNYD